MSLYGSGLNSAQHESNSPAADSFGGTPDSGQRLNGESRISSGREASRVKTVLVLDDDSGSLNVLHWILERSYKVLKTGSAEEAVRLCREHGRNIHLIVADVILRSSMSGTEVCREVRKGCPDIPILFSSGTPIEGWPEYDFDNLRILMSGRVNFLQKPFTPNALVSKVTNLLDGASSSEMQRMFGEAETFRKIGKR